MGFQEILGRNQGENFLKGENIPTCLGISGNKRFREKIGNFPFPGNHDQGCRKPLTQIKINKNGSYRGYVMRWNNI